MSVSCLFAFCPRALHGDRTGRQQLGRVLLEGARSVVELYCPRCREARWYAVTGSSTSLVESVDIARPARPRVLSPA